MSSRILFSTSLITLSRLKGIETLPNRCTFLPFDIALITLSRLKGIETYCQSCLGIHRLWVFDYAFPFEGNWNNDKMAYIILRYIVFDYAFPFEGNWNRSAATIRSLFVFIFDYAFPFEGNWNPMRSSSLNLLISLITLSRLKGIETWENDSAHNLARPLWLRFPVWRELKQRRRVTVRI